MCIILFMICLYMYCLDLMIMAMLINDNERNQLMTSFSFLF